MVIGATKWCVFHPIEISREVVEAAVLERTKRMRTERVDLLQVSTYYNHHRPCIDWISTQFHWNDYSDPEYMTALNILCDLKMEGKITDIGLCNFDSKRTDQICTQIGPDVIVSNQVQVRCILELILWW
jgi:diketogulonate reductase-like aldo/keto reductase